MTDLPAIASAGNRAEVARGRSLESVGQRAKSALAEMRAAGQETPRNANGVVASAIARGIPPENLFAARVLEQPVSRSGDGGGTVPADAAAPSAAIDADAGSPDVAPMEGQVAAAVTLDGLSGNPGEPDISG